MKKTNYTYLTPTEPAALLATLSDRVGEYNAMQGDRRALFTLKSCDTDAGAFKLCVREGATSALNLDLACTATSDGAGTKIEGTLVHDPAEGTPTFGARLYALFLAGFARLTFLALMYGIVLGVSYLFPGRNFWVPAIPPAITLIVMIVRAILMRRRLPKRIDRFFLDFCGCTPE